ncbi:MAG: trimethylamine methyltransferase family protein [candidate division KSB1 bacterium]|nr:trimethylamine methyltransferase family protein [candidate division KSB1 bacterium]MDZ7303167.1 trimethylamine methyltransferase family protein [candidate division KSB1 bacterium]MDZ7310146.1 trimethylamine methyltransferase family protein [candidate division KSB1 bacterium]
MQPKLELLSRELVDRILDEAFQLLMAPGIKVQAPEARKLLADAGAQVDEPQEVARIPETLARQAIATAPREFFLYNHAGNPVVHYGGDAVQFDPGSCGVHVLDPDTWEHKPAQTPDLVRLIKIAEMLPQYDAQSTAVVCSEVPQEIGDWYRLYLVLLYSAKPIVTGAFSTTTTSIMFDMLSIFTGGREALAKKPLAIFDVCPSPPLIWSKFAAQNLIDLATAGVPAEIVSMPLAGTAAPVTLLGAIVQHAAETISGITIHQLAKPGAPIVWGGAPAIFDMRYGTTPMGAIETAMIAAAYAQVGKSLGLPTHGYLGASDAKIVDAQAGLESGITTMIGALAGINMISGAGMLDFLACQSAEKLVVDAEAIAMAKRLLEGIRMRTEPLATTMFEGINFKADFLKQKITRQLFAKEQYLPSSVIDRGSIRSWQETNSLDTFARAQMRVRELLAAYQRPAITIAQERELREMVEHAARNTGMDGLPALPLAI